jgi:hypothetical protein
MAREKKKRGQIPVCAECLSSKEEDRDFYWIEVKEWNPHSVCYISHNILLCEKCMVKLGIDYKERPWSKRKKKKKIDTTGWVSGEPTTKGNPRFIFITPEGTEKLLIADSGLKKGYQPKLKV